MHDHGALPRAREDGLLEETIGEELLLYDQDSHTAHCLSPIAACVWRHCDGEHDVTQLAQVAGAAESSVGEALHELRERELVDAEPEPELVLSEGVSGVSRREAIVRVARYGAAAAPFIVSAAVATPAMASSGCGGKEGKIALSNGIVTLKFKGKVSHVIKVSCTSGEVEGPVEEFSQNEEAFKIVKSTCTGKLLKVGEACEVTIEHTNTIKGQSANFVYNWKNGICPEKQLGLMESE
jgi:DNA-binding transcriptional ArsR family regulator